MVMPPCGHYSRNFRQSTVEGLVRYGKLPRLAPTTY
jgi:hypothetical protein